MTVKIKDRKKEIEILRMALNMADIGVNYETTDLIIRVQNGLNERKDKFNVEDGLKIFYAWKQEWEDYYAKPKESTHQPSS